MRTLNLRIINFTKFGNSVPSGNISVAVAATVAIYALEYLIKPELLEKPSETLKDLVEVTKNSFAKEEKLNIV